MTTHHETLLAAPLYILDSDAMHERALGKATLAVKRVRLEAEWAIADTPVGIFLISATGDGLLRPITDEHPALVDVFVDSARTRAASPSQLRLTASELAELPIGRTVAFADFVGTKSGQQRWMPVLAYALRGESADAAVGGDGRLTVGQRAEIAADVAELDRSIDLSDARELVAEIDVSFARHGALGGGNRWGPLGTFIAMQIERRLGSARTFAR